MNPLWQITTGIERRFHRHRVKMKRWVFDSWRRPIGVILCFHRVLPLELGFKLSSNRDLEITPEELAAFVQLIRQQGCEFLSLDELANHKNSASNAKPFVCFTFDDGYKDNFNYAYPVLKAQQVPFCIYVASAFPDKTISLWWYILEQAILSNTALVLELDGAIHRMAAGSAKEKERAFNRARDLFLYSGAREIEKCIEQLADACGVQSTALTHKHAIDWEDLRMLAKDPLVTIGAHTVTHPNLVKLDSQSASEEMTNSKQRIEAVLGIKVAHFAYPFGDCLSVKRRELELAMAAGFSTATTTRREFLYNKRNQQLHDLPRMGVCGGQMEKMPKFLEVFN